MNLRRTLFSIITCSVLSGICNAQVMDRRTMQPDTSKFSYYMSDAIQDDDTVTIMSLKNDGWKYEPFYPGISPSNELVGIATQSSLQVYGIPRNPLYMALTRAKPSTLDFLLKNRVIYASEVIDHMDYYKAISENSEPLELLKVLTRYGFRLDKKFKGTDKTLLMHLLEDNHGELVIRILDSLDNRIINHVNSLNKSMLFYAQDCEMVHALIERGINLNIRDTTGNTAFEDFIKRGNLGVYKCFHELRNGPERDKIKEFKIAITSHAPWADELLIYTLDKKIYRRNDVLDGGKPKRYAKNKESYSAYKILRRYDPLHVKARLMMNFPWIPRLSTGVNFGIGAELNLQIQKNIILAASYMRLRYKVNTENQAYQGSEFKLPCNQLGGLLRLKVKRTGESYLQFGYITRFLSVRETYREMGVLKKLNFINLTNSAVNISWGGDWMSNSGWLSGVEFGFNFGLNEITSDEERSRINEFYVCYTIGR